MPSPENMIVDPRKLRKNIENISKNTLMACVLGKIEIPRNGKEGGQSEPMFNFIEENILKGSPPGWYIDKKFLRETEYASGIVFRVISKTERYTKFRPE